MLRIRQASCSADKYRTMQIPESTDQFSAFLVGFDTIPNWRPLPDSIHNAAASHNFDPSMRINSTLLKGVPGRTSRPQTTNNQIGYAERTRYADNSAERIPRLISVGFEVVKNGTKAKLKVYGLRWCFPKLLKAIFAPSRLGFRQFMLLVSNAVALLPHSWYFKEATILNFPHILMEREESQSFVSPKSTLPDSRSFSSGHPLPHCSSKAHSFQEVRLETSAAIYWQALSRGWNYT